MKKTRLFAIAGLFTVGLAFGQSVTVTAPNGGEHWMIGNTQQITWTSSGCSGTVRINLVTAGGGVAGTIAAAVPVADGHYAWIVGTLTSGPAPAGEYRIGLYVSSQDVDDRSDAAFSIISPAVGLTLQSPSGGENWELGSSKKIQWMASNVPMHCRLVLLKDGAVKGTIRDSFAPGQGESIWNWVVGSFFGGTAAAGGGYKVRMELIDGSFHAQSDAPFTITPAPMVFAPMAKVDLARIPMPLPDLVACLKWNGIRPYPFEGKRVFVNVQNLGKAGSSATTMDLNVEGHGTKSIPVPALPPQHQVIFDYIYSWGTPGKKTVRLTVDPTGQVAESNEGNNMIEGAITVISLGQERQVSQTKICAGEN